MGEDYEGYLPESPEQTFYVGNYYKAPVEGYVQATGGAPSQPCTQAYCVYFPYVANIIRENISYYYADAQRIAMNKNGEVYYLYGDQLGSVSAVADADGNQISKSLYHSWGTTRSRACIQETDFFYVFDEDTCQWNSVKNDITHFGDDAIVEPEPGFKILWFGSVMFIDPAAITEPTKVRVLVKGYFLDEDRNNAEPVAAFMDVIIEP